MKIYREITGDDDPAFYAEDGIGTQLKEKKPRRIWAVPVDGPVYRTNFGPTDDGSNDTREAHDAWMEVQDLVRDDWLVEIGEDSTP